MRPKRRDYEELSDGELSPELDAMARAMIAEADQDIEETRVNFRWGKSQVETIKRAAALVGVPYQTYIKEAVFRQAIRDLAAATRITKARRRTAG